MFRYYNNGITCCALHSTTDGLTAHAKMESTTQVTSTGSTLFRTSAGDKTKSLAALAPFISAEQSKKMNEYLVSEATDYCKLLWGEAIDLSTGVSSVVAKRFYREHRSALADFEEEWGRWESRLCINAEYSRLTNQSCLQFIVCGLESTTCL